MSETWCPKCQHYHEITTAGGCPDREDLLFVGTYGEGFRDGQEAERRRAAPGVVVALEAVIPCLEDWMATTGFGKVYRRDAAALAAAEAEVKRLWGELGACTARMAKEIIRADAAEARARRPEGSRGTGGRE